MSIQPGTEIGRYVVLEKLGEGGMAVVYKARDTKLDNIVAIKVLRIERLVPIYQDRSKKRFQTEAKNMAKLEHTNIVKVTDFGEFNGVPYLVMPYYQGKTLKSKIGKPFKWDVACSIVIRLADALEYAHNKKIIHRDVKPSNVLINEAGEPLLSDFGIAKVLDNPDANDLTTTMMGMGTVEYMAPEMATSKNIDSRSDIYSLGILFYELLTGRRPFVADTPAAVLIMHAADPLPKPSQYNPKIPKEVENILLKSLMKDPRHRYESMKAFAEDLRQLLQGKVEAGLAPLPKRRKTKEDPLRAIVQKMADKRSERNLSAMEKDKTRDIVEKPLKEKKKEAKKQPEQKTDVPIKKKPDLVVVLSITGVSLIIMSIILFRRGGDRTISTDATPDGKLSGQPVAMAEPNPMSESDLNQASGQDTESDSVNDLGNSTGDENLLGESVPTKVMEETVISSDEISVVASNLPDCDDVAEFISEEIRDGTIFSPGTTFTKSWTIKNDGECTWNTDYKLVYDYGDPMQGPEYISLSQEVKPGQTAVLSVDLVAPYSSGYYSCYWFFISDKYQELLKLYAKITIPGKGLSSSSSAYR